MALSEERLELVSYTIGDEKIAEDGQSAVVNVELEWAKEGKKTDDVKGIKFEGKWWIKP